MSALVLGVLAIGATAYVSASTTSNDSSSDTNYRQVTCHRCKGTGKCPPCGGAGAFCVNAQLNKWVDCANCYDGSCLTCGGDGIIIIP